MKLHALPYHVSVIKTTASLLGEGEVDVFAVKGRGSGAQQPAAPLPGAGLRAASELSLSRSQHCITAHSLSAAT